jgi:Fe-S-cluster containining protein
MSDESHPETVTANITLGSEDWKIQTSVTVPTGPVRPVDLLPIIQSFSDGVVQSAVQASERGGTKVSCKKGCGACCRHLVPVSEVEVLRLRELVSAMPEQRQSELRRRLAVAREKLDEAGLLRKLRHPETCTEQTEQADAVMMRIEAGFALEYFAQGVACPFLEEESCSIYEDRPLACRQHLVSSPAENCARPSAGTIKPIPLPLHPLDALLRFGTPSSDDRVRWVPLVLAFEEVGIHPDAETPRPGPELLQEYFGHLAQRDSARTAPKTPISLAVLVSGEGAALQNLVRRIHDGRLDARIALVLADRDGAGALELARKAKMPSAVVQRSGCRSQEEFSRRIFDRCRQAGAELICMCGFLSRLTIPDELAGRVINVHSSLVPAFSGKGFYGMRIHEAIRPRAGNSPANRAGA